MPLFQRTLRPRTAPDAPTSLLERLGWLPWATLAVAFEVYGRWSPGDGWDLLGALALAAVGSVAWSRWNHRLLRWWHLSGSARWERFSAPWRVVSGFDLRGWPPLPEGVPMRWAMGLAGLSTVGFLFLLGAGNWPGNLRAVLQQASGLGLLLWTAGLASTLLLLGCLAGVAALQFARERWRRGRLAQRVGLVTLGAAWLAAAIGAPAWLALSALLGVALTNVWTTSLLGQDLRLIWRTSVDMDRGPRWGRFSTWESGWVLALVVFVVSLGCLSHGDRWSGNGTSETLWMATLGTGVTWLATGTLGAALLRHQLEVLLSRWKDPARPSPTRVAVLGELNRVQVRRLFAVLRRAGFRATRVNEPEQVRDVDVAVEVVPHVEPRDPWAPEVWPRAISFGEAGDGALHAGLRRRDATLQRRALRRGLESLFSAAEEREFERGSGFWVAPHLWFVFAMSRDEDEEGDLATRIGPPYRQLFPRSARAHLHRLLSDLDIDLIFIEDGVKGHEVISVVNELFETHDLFGAHRLDETRRFNAIPGLRVMVHDFELDSPLLRNGYPEPDYDGLGRARVLHVFRDRGGDQEFVDAPRVGGLVPAWL